MTYPHVQLLINNEWRAARGGATLAVHNPADGSVIGSVARATIADLDDALAATEKGFARVAQHTRPGAQQAHARRGPVAARTR